MKGYPHKISTVRSRKDNKMNSITNRQEKLPHSTCGFHARWKNTINGKNVGG